MAELGGIFYVFGGKDMTLEEDVALVEEVKTSPFYFIN